MSGGGRRIAGTLLPLFLIGVHCGAPEGGESPPRIVSLTRIAEAEHPVEVWVRHGDDRLVLAAPAGEPIPVGPVPASEACVLHAGVAADPPLSGEVTLRVAVQDAEGRVLDVPVPDETVELRRGGWTELQRPLPALGEGGRLVLLGRLAREKGSRIGWGTPYLACADDREPKRPSRPNVLLISIDTLRADHLGVYGYERPTSPRIDALAEESIVFDAAFTTAPWTLPAHASMLTGLYPEEHGAGHATVFTPLAEDVGTVSERLSAAGYRTIAHVGGGYVGRAYGLDRGFDEWLDRHGATLESVLPETLAALSEAGGEPFFLFLHTYGVHGPYKHPDRFPSFRVPGRSEPKPIWREVASMTLHQHLDLGRFSGPGDAIAGYDSCIRFVDDQVGRLLDFLERRGMLDDSLIVVTSDHGESFLERGRYISHGYTFFEEEVRVPLVVRVPGAERTGRSDVLVDSTDVAALLLEVAGVAPSEPLSGASPLARIEGRTPRRELVRGGSAYTGGLYGRTARWKVMTAVPSMGAHGLRQPTSLLPDFDGDEQVYEVSADPGEIRNLTGELARHPAEVWTLHQQLGRLQQPGRGNASREFLDSEQARRLEALGYLDRTFGSPARTGREISSAPPRERRP